jgi:MurNAc alpha-1-phosphate uridylyltransferase
MRAMILAAGAGKRMQPLTLHTPKPLLTLNGKPLIVYHLEAFRRAGVTDVVINLGYLGEQIKEALGDGQKWGVSIQYSPEDPVLETGGGILKALPLLEPDPFIVVSGDVFTDYPFEKLPKKISGLAHLVLVDNPPHHPTGDFALEKGRVVESPGPLLNFGGFGVYTPALFTDCPTGAFPVSLLFEKAIQAGLITGEYYSGVWHNIGTPEQLVALENT